MPVPVEYAGQTDPVVLWTSTGRYDSLGKQLLNSPIEINVRWEDNTMEFATLHATQTQCAAVMMVSRDIPYGSIVWRGRLADLPATPTPLYQVSTRITAPDFKSKYSQRDIMLVEFPDVLPSVVT